ncbi:MAG: VOC family protein [Bacteroidetes bacterium]|nr:MAG: VOC family protein [Bacteroidota bacterium]
MHLLGLRTTIYKVSDLAAARDWYSRVLGAAPYFDEVFYIGFNVAGYELGLQPEEETPAAKPETVLTYWGVADVASAYEHLLTLGAEEHEAPTDVGSGIIIATVRDPWGNIFGLICNPHFSLGE